MQQIEGQAKTNGCEGEYAGARCVHTLEQHLCHVVQATRTHLVYKLKQNIQRPELETAPMRSFQTHAAEQVTERWEGLTEFTPESPIITLLAASLDPRFRKLRFLPADEVLKVQNTVRAMALAAKQQVRQPTASNHGASSTAQDSPPAAHATRATSFLDSDSTTSDGEQDEEQQLNESVQPEVTK